ncbi:hypothetical protein DYB25_003495 [Aphanomyces astaci]|uniref:Uncharacterized protein n=1 Tax=Aphanomyces astaci TaxID=112090 RepID=A0A397BZ98_APHAT|nr:hypothetical protein DYB25_003495 [Aphanomyces astaci]
MLRFQDCHAGSCTFRSKASVKKATSNASTDAVQVEFESASTQTAVAVENGSQTEYISRDSSTTHPPDEVSPAVQAFLNSAGNCMLREMKHANKSSAFLELKWSTNAQRLVGAAPQSADVRRHVEAHAKDKKLREIRVASVFDAKPDVGALYRSALDFAFEPHGGPVYDIQYSPFHPSLFLTASSDGTLPEPKLISVALEGLENILAAGERQGEADGTHVNAFVSVIEDCDGVTKIENLQYHEQTDIYNKALGLIERFFQGEGDDDVDGAGVQDGRFQFGFDPTANTTFSFGPAAQ